MPNLLDDDPFAGGKVLESGNSMPEVLPPVQNTTGRTRDGEEGDLFGSVRSFIDHGDPETGGGAAKKKRPPDHNALVKKEMERHGYLVYKTETEHQRWSHGERITWKTDLLGFMDYQAIKEGQQGVTAVQACARDQVKPHLRKFRDIPEVRTWLRCGNRLIIVGAYQEGGKGSRWRFETTHVTEAMLDEYEARKRKK